MVYFDTKQGQWYRYNELKNEFTVQVYESNAHIALEKVSQLWIFFFFLLLQYLQSFIHHHYR
jgi:hypothetical protein